MTAATFERLAEALNRLPNGFSRTSSGVEIRILRRIFSSDEAALAAVMGKDHESAQVIAFRSGQPVDLTEAMLSSMADRGLLWSHMHEGKDVYRLAPFVVGIYEAQTENMDHEFAHLFEQYMEEGGAAGIMRHQPAIHRVVPAQNAVKTEWILPYDDVKPLLENSKSFFLRDCICRVQQDHIGRKCDFPVRTCLSFAKAELPPRPTSILKKEALEFLDKAEEMGLVHTVSNVAKGLGYVCNCCGCCCGLVRAINDWGVDKSVAAANYYAVIDENECLGCFTCVKRCQVKAISEGEGHAVVNREKCIGCGLCVTGCPNDVAKLVLKPGERRIEPPADFAAWEVERLRNRGIA